jgi:hypothetical protein
MNSAIGFRRIKKRKSANSSSAHETLCSPGSTSIMASHLSSRQFQRGYLLEIPLILFILLLALAILAPRLSPIGQKVTIGAAALPIVFCLFYIIVAPGWVPGSTGRACRDLRVALFVGLAAAILAGAGDFILR